MDGLDKERSQVIHTFYNVYRSLQKQCNLREYGHFDVYGNNSIEVWEYDGESKKHCVCKVNESDEIECYRKAIQVLKDYKRCANVPL